MFIKGLKRIIIATMFWKRWPFWVGYLRLKDYLYVHFKDRSLLPLHLKLKVHVDEQIEKWPYFVYCGGYCYQGFDKIGIKGIKPTEKRIKNYDIQSYFDKDKDVFDIGSNNGFFAMAIGGQVRSTLGIEINLFLLNIAEDTKKFLNKDNVFFKKVKFEDYKDIIKKYFFIEKSKMVKDFYSPDIDKLFVVLRKKENIAKNIIRTFELKTERDKYQY